MILAIYTVIHVIISLVAIASGFVVLFGMLQNKRLEGWTRWFLWTTVATSVTGFFFPFHGIKPSYIVGAISLVLLSLAIMARCRHQMAGGWRLTYVMNAVTALYLNVFVLIVQSFLKVPALKAMAPTQSEPPFKMAQLGVLVFFIVMGILAARRFKPLPE